MNDLLHHVVQRTDPADAGVARSAERSVRAAMIPRALLAVSLLASADCAAPDEAEPQWVAEPTVSPQTSGTTALLIALGIVNRDTVWASGSGGTWVRTTDGVTWTAGVVPGADSLQFRDVEPVNGNVAYLLSIGNGPSSRIYKTTDAGANWSLQFVNQDPNAFYDCFDFWDENHGIAFSDSHDGHFSMVFTDDGTTWSPVPISDMPAATPGEGGFASSGTCLVVDGDSTGWIGTGAGPGAGRVLRTADRGRSWTIAQTPLHRGPSGGITTLALATVGLMSAIGGDIGNADTVVANVAVSTDAGVSWSLATGTPFRGAAYGSAWVPGAPSPTLVAVGPGGLAFSTDRARTWTAIDTLNHWGVAFAAPDAGWAVGPRGRISRIALFRRAP